MARHDLDFKRTVVRDYLEGTSGFRVLATKHGIDRSTVRQWVDVYRQHGDAGLRRKAQGQGVYYSAKDKLKALKRMWREGLSYRQMGAFLNLRGGTGIIGRWERQYHEGGLEALEPMRRGRPKKMPAPQPPKPSKSSSTPVDESKALQALRKENEYLRAEVAYLKKLDALVRAKQQATQTKQKP